MNKQIEDVMYHAGLTAQGCWDQMDEYDQKAIEKFAELIVRECATTCDNIGKEARKEWKAKYIPHDDGRSDGAWECKAAILEHFGVEE